jgi:hypothetical protein
MPSIPTGEYYFKRKDGPAYTDVIKLSRLSMERFLFALFSGNFGLEQFTQQVNEQRPAELTAEHARYSPVDHILGDNKE